MVDFRKHIKMSTRVETNVSLSLLYRILKLICHAREFTQLDYIQEFELSIIELNDRKVQKIRHLQKTPPYQNQYLFGNVIPIEASLRVIDDGNAVSILYEDEMKS